MFAASQQSKYEIIDAEKAGGYTVQGAKASVLEYRVALAAERLKIPFLFQYEMFGGSTRRGGVILDFLFLIAPLSIPGEVMGGYWHRSAHTSEDKLKEALVRQQGNFGEMVYWWEGELQTKEDAYRAVKRELRV